MQPYVVGEFCQEEKEIMSLTTRFKVDEKRFVVICDQDIVWAKISVRKSENMELVNDIKNAKKELFIDLLMASQ